jgi:hypothetical protein
MSFKPRGNNGQVSIGLVMRLYQEVRFKKENYMLPIILCKKYLHKFQTC